MGTVHQTSNLYVLKPALINDVFGRFETQKNSESPVENVIQTVEFMSIPGQIVIATKQDGYYLDACMDKNKRYYDAEILEGEGLYTGQRRIFTNIFRDDIIDLVTFSFIDSFEHFGRRERRTFLIDSKRKAQKRLRDEYYRDELSSKPEYSIEELQALREHLLSKEDDSYIKTKRKKYIAIKKTRGTYYFNKVKYSTRDTYAGTAEEKGKFARE
ncbi:MAG: hypothetical protein V8R01_07935 [Bacilli bacterium]